MQDKEAKQGYLREHVLDQGYDGEDFLEYCEKMIGNVDIDSWTFQDLEHIVVGYIQHKAPQTSDSVHETSYAIYQEKDQIQQPVRPPSPSVKNRPPSPVLKMERYPIKSKKDILVGSTFDNSPSPTREITQHNKTKLAASEKSNLDQLFKDPFSKKPNKHQSQWDSNVWSKATQKKPTTNFNKFDFDEIIPKAVESVGNSKPSVEPISKIQPMRAHAPKAESKKQKPRESPVMGNTKIFDINFDDITDVQTLKKSNQKSPTQTSVQQKVELAQSVEPFKMQWNSPKASTAQVVSSLHSDYKSPNLSESRKKQKQQGNKIVQEDWYDVVKCIKAKTRQLALKPNLQIVVTGHEVVNRNVFMPDYVRYFISTPAINSEVKRKYNHFAKLRANLQKFYPGFRLPYLAKGSWFQESDPNNISAQKTMITHFMNDILMNRELRNCRIVEEFLTLKDYKGLKVKFEEYEKMAILHSIQELCLMQGEIGIGYSEGHRVHTEKLPPYIQSLEGVFDKYKKLLDQLVNNHLALQKTLNDLSETTKLMQQMTKNFNSSVEMGQCYELQGTLKLINKLYKQLDKQSKFDMDLIDSQLKPLFRYERQNLGTIRQLVSQKHKFQQSFNPNHKSEKPQKKQSYTSQSLNQYKIRINDPSKSLTVLFYQHGYYSNQTVVQSKRMLTNLSDKFSNKFGQFCHEYHERVIEYSKFWHDIKGAISLPVVQ